MKMLNLSAMTPDGSEGILIGISQIDHIKPQCDSEERGNCIVVMASGNRILIQEEFEEVLAKLAAP